MAKKDIYDKKGKIKPSKVIRKPKPTTGIKILEADSVKLRGSDRPYAAYVNAIIDNDIVNWANVNIAASPGKQIVVKTEEFAEAMGMLINKQPYDGGKKAHSIYWGTKFAMYVMGHFQVEMGTNKENEPVLIISHAPSIYQLPVSLRVRVTDKDQEHIQPIIEQKHEQEEQEAAAALAAEEEEAAEEATKLAQEAEAALAAGAENTS